MTDDKTTGSYSQMVKRTDTKGEEKDYYPTPPWITRAAIEFLHQRGIGLGQVWEPACGQGDMVKVLQEYGYTVLQSDLFAQDYGLGPEYVIDFAHPVQRPAEDSVDTVFTNPPFGYQTYDVPGAKEGKTKKKRYYRPDQFMLNGLHAARAVVAILVRTNMVGGVDRVRDIYGPYPPTFFVQFPQRLNFHKGSMQKKKSGMVDFAWMIWVNRDMYPTADIPALGRTELAHFPTDGMEKYERDGDYPEPEPDPVAQAPVEQLDDQNNAVLNGSKTNDIPET